MKFSNPFLDELAGSHNQILVFDCEFWHVLGSKGFIPIDDPHSNEFFMPREIGGFFLNRSSDGQWIYKNHFFVTFNPPKGKEVSFVSSMFSNVSRKTAEIMDDYQSLLNVPWASAYLNVLPHEMQDLLVDDIRTYLNDSNIKKAHKPPSWYKSFVQEYSNSLVIVKGENDIKALENACRFYNISYSKPKELYDIAEWNLTSRKKCGTAKLEGTYECIVDKLEPETKRLTKILPIGEAHDPSSDAAMTLIVALYIIQKQ